MVRTTACEKQRKTPPTAALILLNAWSVIVKNELMILKDLHF